MKISEKSDALAVPVDVMMRRPTLVGVPAMPILAAPLLVRRAQVEEAGALAALLGRAFEAERWDVAGTERELFGDVRYPRHRKSDPVTLAHVLYSAHA